MRTMKCAKRQGNAKAKPSLPPQLNIVQYIRFWTGNAIPESKGGSFNVDLYINYLTIKSKL